MRIVSVKPVPVGFIFAIVYAIFGFVNFLLFAFSSPPTITLPVGIIMGIFHLNLDFHLARSADLIANAFDCIGSILSFALTGWITGITVVLSFNLIAKKIGGIDAKFVSVTPVAPLDIKPHTVS